MAVKKRQKKMKISVIGDGGWGTALALHAYSCGHCVRIWSAFPDYAKQLNKKRENSKYLPGIVIPKKVEIIDDLEYAIVDADIIILAVPTQFVRGVLARIATMPTQGKILVNVAKGIENSTFLTPYEIMTDMLSEGDFAVLSGPSHAEEVARKVPTCVVVASKKKKTAECLQQALSSACFRVYTSEDMIGVEMGGALKNVIAIAAGMCDGLQYGSNTKAALLSRGLREITRLGVKMGAQAETFSGLTGLGDLVTTCFSPFGRNRAVGEKLAQGKTIKQVMDSMDMVAEGVRTAQSVEALARKKKIDMPICHEVYRVIYYRKSPRKALTDLMMRSPKAEVM